MNKTQKIIIEETIYLGLAVPSGISIVLGYLIPAIRESGLKGLLGSVMNIFLLVMTFLITYVSYEWIVNIGHNIDRTERLMSNNKTRFYNFIAKIFLTFLVTFILVIFVKNKLGL